MGDISPPFEIGSAMPPRGRARSGSSFAGQDLFWIALAGAVAGFVLLVLKPNRERIREAEAECRLLGAEIASLQARVRRLRRWERALASGDRDAWTAVARERLGWVAPGEKIVPLGTTTMREHHRGRDRLAGPVTGPVNVPGSMGAPGIRP